MRDHWHKEIIFIGGISMKLFIKKRLFPFIIMSIIVFINANGNTQSFLSYPYNSNYSSPYNGYFIPSFSSSYLYNPTQYRYNFFNPEFSYDNYSGNPGYSFLEGYTNESRAISAIANQPPGESGSWSRTDNDPTIITYDGDAMTMRYDPEPPVYHYTFNPNENVSIYSPITGLYSSHLSPRDIFFRSTSHINWDDYGVLF